MANFTSAQASKSQILECIVKYTYTDPGRGGDKQQVYNGIDAQVMDEQGNVYQLTLSTTDLSESRFNSADSSAKIISALHTKLQSTTKSRTDDRITYGYEMRLTSIEGRMVGDID